MAVLADVFYGSAWKELTVTGIGGTKGKSTSAYYMKSIVDDYMKEIGKPESAVISSIDIMTVSAEWSPILQRQRR